MTTLAQAQAAEPASYRADRRDGVLRVALEGDWVTAEAAQLDRALRAFDPESAREIEIDASRLGRLDSTGAWLLTRLQRQAAEGGRKVTALSVPERYVALLDALREKPIKRPEPARRVSPFLVLLNGIGGTVVQFLQTGYAMIGYLGLVAIETAQTVTHRRLLRITGLFRQVQETAVSALPILGLLAMLLGVVIAYQGVDQLRKFGAEIYTVNLLGVSMLREIAVLITAIIVAGRSGSAFAAHIGTMKLNQEIDALETSGIDIGEVLILPRVIGLTIAMPLLAFFADVMGLIGGALMCYIDLNISFPAFIRQLHDAITPATFWVGMIKAPVFGFIIALVGCFEGLRVEGNAASVGYHTTRAVVEAIFLVIVFDAGFSILFSIWDI